MRKCKAKIYHSFRIDPVKNPWVCASKVKPENLQMTLVNEECQAPTLWEMLLFHPFQHLLF